MRLRTRTPRRVAAAGLALVTATALAACSSGDENTDATSEDPASSTQSEESEEDATPQLDDTPPEAPMSEVVLAEGEAPGRGVVQVVEPGLLQAAVDKLVADQGKELMDTPACDRVSRLETISNHATGDAVTAAVRYKESEENETEHRFGVGMVPKRLDDYLDRSLYEACTNATSTTAPNVALEMKVSDAPEIAGTEGFRVTSDFITTLPDGTKSLSRAVALHGYGNGTSVSVEYAARSDDPAKDPVLPKANEALDAIYTAQMEKLLKAE